MAVIAQASIDSLKSGASPALTAIQNAVAAKIYAESLPLVGTQLQAANASGTEALRTIEAMKTAIVAALNDLGSATDHASEDVQDTLDDALAAAGFTGSPVGIAVNGGDVTLTFDENRAGSWTQTLDTALGLPGIDIDTTGTAAAGTDFSLAFEMGVDASGFFVDTSGNNEIDIDLSIGTPTLTSDVGFNLLTFTGADAGSGFTGTFDINLTDANGDGMLRLDELNGPLVSATLTGQSDVAIELTADLGTTALPSVSALLGVGWDFNAATVDPSDDNSGFGNVPDVALNDVTIDLGAFVSDFIRPVLGQIAPVLTPINQVLDVLTARIEPVEQFDNWEALFDADGNGRATLLDMIALAGVDTAPIQEFVDTASNILDWFEFFDTTVFGADEYVIGDFAFSDSDIRDLATTLADAPATFGGFVDTLGDTVAGLTGSGWSATDLASGLTGQEVFADLVDGGEDSAFAFPILTDPAQIISLLLGGTADLVEVDLPEFGLSFNEPLLVSIPIVPFINASLGGGVSASLDLGFGYDTRGLLAEGGGLSTALDGFYIIDGDGAEASLSASLSVSLGADVFAAQLFGSANVTGTIELDLNDDLGERTDRLYLDEFGAALADNPFSIFDASGAIRADVSLTLRLAGIGEWGIRSPQITLASFNFDETETALGTVSLGLAVASGGTLTLNTGVRAGQRQINDNTDGDEVALIGSNANGLVVEIQGTQEAFTGINRVEGNGGLGNDQFALGSSETVVGDFDGGVGDDALFGGAAGDTLVGGADDDYLDGRGGDDDLSGGTGNDRLFGRGGADDIDGGAGQDEASYQGSAQGVTVNTITNVNTGGDAQGDTLTSIEIIEGSDLDDTITMGDGGVTVLGRAGNDTLTSGGGNDVLVGNSGDDTLIGGAGQDVMVGGLGDDTYHVDDAGDIVDEDRIGELTRGGPGGHDTVLASVNWSLDTATGAEIEDLTLTGAALTGIGNAGANTILGNNLGNSIDGLGGADTIEGRGGNDRLFGGGGIDTISGGEDDDEIDGGAEGDILDGDAGDDILNGGTGIDTMRGGTGDDTYIVDSALDVVTEATGEGTDTVIARTDYVLDAATEVEILRADGLVGLAGRDLTANDLDQQLFGDGGNDTLDGRGGADALDGGLGTDTATYRNAATGVTIDLALAAQIGGEAEGDTYTNIEIIEGSAHIDRLTGTGADDHFRGLASADILTGLGGADTLEGGAGADLLDGGTGDDIMRGGADDDRYLVDSLGDVVDETGGSGTDLVETGISYSLESIAGVENLTILGAALTATGNELNNVITGNANNNTLDGLGGADRLIGGLGDDRYIIDNVGDFIVEGAGEGLDTVHLATSNLVGSAGGVSVDMGVMAENVEILTIGDDLADVTITGNDTDNIITGNARTNTIYGEAGDDTLIAGSGGRDRLYGGTGNDSGAFAFGSTGSMVFAGGDDEDMLIIDWSDSERTVSGTLSNGTGRYSTSTSTVGLQIDYTDVERFHITSGSARDVVFGGSLRDELITGGGSDRVTDSGGGGIYHLGTGEDYIVTSITDEAGTLSDLDFRLVLSETQAGPVVLNAGTAWETSWQGVETIRVTVGDGDNLLDTRGVASNFGTHAVARRFTTGDGDDVYATDMLGTGTSTFTAGGGEDLLILDWGDSTRTVSGTLDGNGDGRYSTSTSTTGLQLNFTGVERFHITSGSARDTIVGGALRDTLITGGGSDRVTDGGGGGIYHLGTGEDYIGTAIIDEAGNLTTEDFRLVLADTQTGPVILNAGTAWETSWEGIETIRVTVGDGDNLLDTRGVASNFGTHNIARRFTTGNGDDTYATDMLGTGTSTYTAGGGEDLLILDWGDSTRTVSGTLDGNGDGRYSTSTSTTGLQLNFTGVERFHITSGSGNDSLVGGALRDTLVTGAGRDRVIDWSGGGGIYHLGDGEDYIGTAIIDEAGNITTEDFRLVLADTRTGPVILNAGTAWETSWEGIETIRVTVGDGDNLLDTRGVASNYAVHGVSRRFTTGEGDDVYATDMLGTGTSSFLAGEGEDLIILDWADSERTVSSSLNGDGNGNYSTSANNTGIQLNFTGVERFQITSGSASDTLRGAGLRDSFTSGAGNDQVFDGGGGGIYHLGTGQDYVNTVIRDEAGNITTEDFRLILADTQNGPVVLNAGTAWETSWQGIETIRVTVGDGDNLLDTRGVVSNYNIHGVARGFWTGSGDDVYATDLLGTSTSTFSAGDGEDLIILDWANSTATVSSTVNAEGNGNYSTSVGNTGVQLSFTSVERFQVTSGSASDTLRGAGLRDTFVAGAGNDQVFDGGGGGIYHLGTGQDYVNTVIRDEAGNITTEDFRLILADTQNGPVVLNAGTAWETSWQGIETIRVTVGDGDNLLDTRGVVSNYNIHGVARGFWTGSGDDVYATDLLGTSTSTFSAGDGEDLIILDWANSTATVSSTVNAEGNGNYSTSVGNTGVQLSFTSVERFQITAGSGNDTLRGAGLRDTFVAGAGNDQVFDGGGGGIYHLGDGHDYVNTIIRDEAGNITTEDFRLILADTQNGPVVLNAGTAWETSWQGIETIRISTGSGNDLLDTRGVVSNYNIHGVSHGFWAGDGDDTFITDLLGTSTATYAGGEGEDTLILDWSDSTRTVSSSLNSNGDGNYSTATSDGRTGIQTSFTSVEEFDIRSGSANDTLRGGALGDRFFSGAGVDTVTAGDGNDQVRGGAGGDTLNGGGGRDWLQYGDSAAAVVIDLNHDAITGYQSAFGGDAEGDAIWNFEMVNASDFDDILTGDDENNFFIGRRGSDTIVAGAGNDVVRGGRQGDTMSGGDGTDWLQYIGSRAGVTIDLAVDPLTGMQSASEGDAEGDVIDGFENITGSDHGDMLTGDEGRNALQGRAGDDEIFGAGGNDRVEGGTGGDLLDGGAGIDWLLYNRSSAGVTIDLSIDDATGMQTASGGEAEGDRITGFERVLGSSHDDTLTGNDEINYLSGGDGADVIDAGRNRDVVRGGADGDTLDGGHGYDLVTYVGSQSGVVIDLRVDAQTGVQSASGGDAEGDRLTGFENVTGSDHADRLTGDAGVNMLSGRGGDDVVAGGLGNDRLRGGEGMDRFIFAENDGDDIILDFEQGMDEIDLGDTAFGGLTISATATGALIEYGVSDSIEVRSIDGQSLTLDQDDFALALG